MKMRGSDQKILLMVMVVVTVATASQSEEPSGFVTWANNYYLTWGHQALVLNETSELHLTLDHNSGFYLSFCLYVCVYFVSICVMNLCLCLDDAYDWSHVP